MSEVTFDYRAGFTAYPEERSGPGGNKAPHIDYGTAPPDKTRYFSQEEADLEWKHVWMKTWAFAGLLIDIPSVGDYFRYNLGKESFVVVRTGPGEQDIKAYYNVCPHRGNRLVHNDFGSTSNKCFTCDFHGWKYNLDGTNKEIRDEIIFRPEVICDRPGLTEVSVGSWQSLVFVNPDPHPRLTLLEHLDVMPGHLKNYDFRRLRVFRDLELTWDANWKTAFEAFIEFYHADDVHPEAIPVSEMLETQYDLFGHGLSRMIIPQGYVTSRFEDRETVNEFLKMFVSIYGGDPGKWEHLKGHEYKKALMETKRDWGRKHGHDFFEDLTDDQITDDWNYSPFPNMTINVFADTLLLQIFRPHATDPRKSVYNAITLCLPVSDDVTPVLDLNAYGPESFGPPGWKGDDRPARFEPQQIEEMGFLLAQDARRVPEVQKGIESECFVGSRLSESEIRARHYLAEIDRLVGRAPPGPAGQAG
jgi:phenylpropionate dioxygenase-like ring-hydroxylating dioxygenase large terminal subunit